MLVSVIVPTKNSANYLERCLESVRAQTYSPIEIIVVDNNSTDDTKEIARRFTTHVYNRGPERSAQRNYGAEMANGALIYFIDSDFVLDPRVVEEAALKCQEGYELIAVHNSSDPTVSVWSKVRKFERDMYKYDASNIAVRCMTREAFMSVGGYNESLIAAEDYDLHNRLLKKGYRLGFIDAEEMHLGEPRTLGEVYQKHYFYGKTIMAYIHENKDQATTQLKPVRNGFLKHKGEFFRHPLLTGLLVIYLFVKYFAGAMGLLFSYFKK